MIPLPDLSCLGEVLKLGGTHYSPGALQFWPHLDHDAGSFGVQRVSLHDDTCVEGFRHS